jgi:hypothetical protein
MSQQDGAEQLFERLELEMRHDSLVQGVKDEAALAIGGLAVGAGYLQIADVIDGAKAAFIAEPFLRGSGWFMLAAGGLLGAGAVKDALSAWRSRPS